MTIGARPAVVDKKKMRAKKTDKAVKFRADHKPLRDLTEDALKSYFDRLNGHKPGDLYDLVIGEVEEPLLKTVMDYSDGNQSRAADILGINRGTLRKKLRHYSLLG